MSDEGVGNEVVMLIASWSSALAPLDGDGARDEGLAVSASPLGGESSVLEVLDEVRLPPFESLVDSDEILVVLLASSGVADARSVRAVAKAGGNARPRLSARRKIPAAAFRLKKNRLGALSSSTSAKDENAPPALGHSEVSAVQHSPGEVVKPEVAQRTENDGEISSTLGREQAGDILNEDPSSCAYKLICDSSELEEQS